MTDTIKVGIYGAAGYAGQTLVQILSQHPQVQMIFATSSTYAGELLTHTDLRYVDAADAPLSAVDVVFLALPHRASADYARTARDAGKRVIDLSADLRFDTADAYQTWYDVAHPQPDLLPVPYGLPELHRDHVVGADIVAVPGCYPTATLLGLYPLLSVNGLSLEAPIIVDAKSGISGAGRNPSPKAHFVEAYGNITPYKAGRVHRHVGEIEKEIRKLSPITEPLIFTPHLVPVDVGLMASLYLTLNYSITSDRVHSLYTNLYDDEPLVDLLPLGEQASFKHVQHQNHCTISITPISERYLHITSVIDNLRKGAAAQAVQCFNLMYDLPETTAIR